MRSNNKHSAEELEKYIHLFLEDGINYKHLKNNYGLQLSQSKFRLRVLQYKEHGIDGITSSKRNNHYSQEFKYSVVEEYLNGGVSCEGLTVKYNIPSIDTVSSWVLKYTKGNGLKKYSPKPEVYTMKARKTTQEERVEIVKDYLKNNFSYKEAAEKHNISYNNIYSWVQKYKKHGPDGLIDGRGRRKPDEIQTDEEKIKTELAALKARNDYLETENAALKKLKEVERELMSRKQGM